jgi:hypothetical protein
MDPSVRFFVRVAAVALIFVSDIVVILLSSILFYLTGYTRTHIAHHIVKLNFFKAGGAQVGAPSTDGFLGIRVSASQLAGRTDVDAPAAETASIALHVERRPQRPMISSPLETNGVRHHLF